jgi:hypothetical protein
MSYCKSIARMVFNIHQVQDDHPGPHCRLVYRQESTILAQLVFEFFYVFEKLLTCDFFQPC